VLILALDTSSPSGSLAVLRDEKVIGVVSTANREVYSSRMFRELDSLLAQLALRMEHFELFAVAAGPGSFTGLRLGLTAVKGWAEVYKRPIAAVSALEAVAVQASSEAQIVVPVLDARRGQVYFGLYRRISGGPAKGQLVLDGEEYVMTVAELFASVCTRISGVPFTIVTPAPELLSASGVAGAADNFAVETASSVLAPFIGQLGLQRAHRGALVDALTLDANYVRRSDAELHWKES
jgi:tRNA threonylcarbamoyladenosine biosynthesis protein TsaB